MKESNTPADETSGRHRAGGSILVVDDDRDVLTLVTIILKNAGHDVLCAESGEKALELLARHDFAAMLTDLNMPGMNGLELARRARLIAPGMTIIMGTGEVFPDLHRRAAKAGIARVFAKPFNCEELISAMKSEEKSKGLPDTGTGDTAPPLISGLGGARATNEESPEDGPSPHSQGEVRQNSA